jgi:hypothetical protein
MKMTCVISCNSTDTLLKVREIAKRFTDLNEQITRKFTVYFPVVKHIEALRLGNHFDKIEMLPSAIDDPASFVLVFHIKNGVDSAWKYLLVHISQTIRSAATGTIVSILPANRD